MMKKLSLIILCLLTTFQMSMFTTLNQTAQAAEINGEISEDYTSDEMPEANPLEGLDSDYLNSIESESVWYDIGMLDWLTQDSDYISIPSSDQIALTDYRVDTRVTDYLLELVRPEDLGGLGLSNVKVSRLLKNYDSEGVGRFDREYAGSTEEDSSFISTHNRGQAVDISEAGSITCKVVLGNKLGSRKTMWQAPRSIKVAWQSKDGINHTPTPRGPSLAEIAGNISANQVLTAMNETGEMDAWVDFTRGLDLGTIISYVGASVLLKNLGLDKINSDPLSEYSLTNMVGAAVLYKTFPDLPEGIMQQSNGEDIRVSAAKAEIESKLGLPSGSLRGSGWDKILESAGKRALENSLRLPSLSLDRMSLEELNRLPAVQGAFGIFSQADKTLNLPSGTTEQLRNGNREAVFLAGVNVLANALRLDSSQRGVLEQAARSVKISHQSASTEAIEAYAQELYTNESGRNYSPTDSDDPVMAEYRTRAAKELQGGTVIAFTPPSITLSSLPISTSVPLDTLAGLVSKNGDEQARAREDLVDRGIQIFQKLADKAVPSSFSGVGQSLVNQLSSKGKEILLGKTKTSLGEKKLGAEGGFDNKDQITWQNKPSGRQAVADTLNQDLSLKNDNILSADDFANKPLDQTEVVNKVGAKEAETAFGWDVGTGMAVIKGKATANQAFEGALSKSLGEMMGLDNRHIDLKGDVSLEYGQAIVESSLGAPDGLFYGKESVDDLSADQLIYFGIEQDQSIIALRADPSYWEDAGRVAQWELMDARMGVSRGSTRDTLRNNGSLSSLSRKASSNGFANLTLNMIWSQFDLDESLHLSTAEGIQLITNLQKMGSLSGQDLATTISLGLKVVGRQYDGLGNLPQDTLYKYITAPSQQEGTKELLNAGIYTLVTVFGSEVADFDADQARRISQNIIDLFNGADPGDVATDFIVQALDIPTSYRTDAEAIKNGDLKTIIGAWTVKNWLGTVNDYLPGDAQISYEQARVAFTNPEPAADQIQQEAASLYGERTGNDFFSLASTDPQISEYSTLARRRLIEKQSETVQYYVSDALLRRSGVPVPPGFTLAMMRGSDTDRAKVSQQFVLYGLEKYLRDVDPRLPQGTLTALWENRGDRNTYEPMLLGILASHAGIDFGPFTAQTMRDMVQIVLTPQDERIYTSAHQSSWSAINSWAESQFGIGDLPTGFAQSVFYASKNGWSYDSRVLSGDQVLVPSLSDLGNDFLSMRLSSWADDQLGLQRGTTYQLYSGYDKWRKGQLSDKDLYLIAINVALSNCGACQKVFHSVDSALGAPAGFTDMAVRAGISFWLLGPQTGWIALGMAVAYYFYGWSSSKYLCPIPPPDWYGSPGYDQSYDTLSYKWGTYYDDPAHPVESSPEPGQTAWEWIKQSEDEGRTVQFADGNDPDLWMAWARYFTGKLIADTIDYGITRSSPYKPKQISTFRQANVYNFAPLSLQAFGSFENNNLMMGLGFTQNTTKTTDWVHIAFGGLF